MVDEKGKKIPPSLNLKSEGHFLIADKSIVIEQELAASTELQHEMLAALLSDDDPAKVAVEYKNEKDILTVKLTISHTRDIVADAKVALKLRQEARDKGITVEEHVRNLNEATAKVVKAAKGEK
jgi:hypothetical protein